MYGMDKMGGCEHDDVSAKLQVLDEIKSLMDKRLGGKLGEMANPKGVEVSSVKVMGDDDSSEGPMHEQMESPEMEKMEEKTGMSEEDLMKLKMARQKMLG